MSSIMLSSNANSAMIQTVSASDSMKNPNIYSTETVFPAHALTWVKCESSSGSVGDGAQLNFQLQKYGIISQMLLVYEKEFGSHGAAALPAGDVFRTIRQVELLASSKTVSILTAEDLMAQFSDCSQSEFNVVKDTAIGERTTAETTVETTGTRHRFVVPLCFPQFEMINCQLDSSFLEPLQVRITWNTIKSSGATYATVGMPVCHLKMRYKNYSEQDTAAMISANYSAPQLNQLSARFYDEAKVDVPVPITTAVSVRSADIDLKNTECVESFYVILKLKEDTSASGAFKCHPITLLKFTGSGQEICELDETDLQYARLGMNGWSEQVDASLTASGVQLAKIGKIQLGLNTKQKATNSLSLREVNAPRIHVEWNHPVSSTATTYEITVVQKVLAVFATSSATGRYSLALAN